MAVTPESQSKKINPPSGLKPSGTLGRFELRRILGQGAQSTVWLAFDPRMEREVAIKVLRPVAGANDQAIKHWLEEARSVGRVKHPSIVPVFEADVQDQHAYLVFEYVSGETLAQRLANNGVLAARDAVACMMDVLDAIAVAHTEGVIHRDIKPSNILVDSSGRARVMDFGIAARVRGGSDDAAVAVGGILASTVAIASSDP